MSIFSIIFLIVHFTLDDFWPICTYIFTWNNCLINMNFGIVILRKMICCNLQLLNICQYSSDHMISWTSFLCLLSFLFLNIITTVFYVTFKVIIFVKLNLLDFLFNTLRNYNFGLYWNTIKLNITWKGILESCLLALLIS